MALVGVLSLTLAAAPLPAMAEEGGSASDENATQTVTVYHFEMVYYDDPTFEDWGVPELTGLRLIGTSTVEGLKPGVTYQYRAVLFNESNTMRGEMNLFVKD